MNPTPPRSLDASIETAVAFARLTTVGIGGPAQFLARPGTVADLESMVTWAAAEGIEVVGIGLGSNVLVADTGVDALVVRLAGELAAVRTTEWGLAAGGGAANAVCLHRARAAGLSGMEFACAIPGTAGGGVRMNAGAYGADWAGIVRRALVVDRSGAAWMSNHDLDLTYRHSALDRGQIVAEVEFELEPRPESEIRRTVAELNATRKATQPTNKRTFGSVFKNPAHELGAGKMLDTCGLRGFRIGGAQISPRHANFIENVDGATSSDAVGLIAEARRRALETFGVVLETEVELLGDIELPPAGERAP